MLLQRLRCSEPALESAIAYNLVDLALPAPSEMLLEIAKSYSQLSVSAMTADPASERHNSVSGAGQFSPLMLTEFGGIQILAAQTRLAHELGDKPDMLRPYLAELLSLFNNLGTIIQMRASKQHDHQPVRVHLLYNWSNTNQRQIGPRTSQASFGPSTSY